MTLQEAVDHAYEKALDLCACGNQECSNDHYQLAKWLEELKIRRTSSVEVKINDELTKNRFRPKTAGEILWMEP
jgi:hypothetical protein